MSTQDDRRAAWLLFGVALLGLAVRWVGSPSGTAPGDVGFHRAQVRRPPIDSLEARSRRVARPLAPGERVDLDVAPAFEIARLPGVGPALAARIVAYRDSSGRFGSLEAFDRLPGVGPRLISAIAGSVTFGGRVPTAARPIGGDRIDINHADAADLARLPGIGTVKAQAIIATREANGPFRSVQDLTSVPGIGPVLAERLRPRVRIP